MTIDIKTLLFKHNINQQEFADFCGVSLRMITYYFSEDEYDHGKGLPEMTRRNSKNIKELASKFAKIKKLK